MEGYSRRSNENRDMQPVAIQAVNLQTRKVTVFTRTMNSLEVDSSFAVGEVFVIPAVGEQWYIERVDAAWRLYGRIPFNDSSILVEPAEGQVGVGSARGPLELHGTVVNAHAPIRLAASYTAARPDAAGAGVGAMIYDITLSQPLYSDGTVWRDGAGTAV